MIICVSDSKSEQTQAAAQTHTKIIKDNFKTMIGDQKYIIPCRPCITVLNPRVDGHTGIQCHISCRSIFLNNLWFNVFKLDTIQ